MAERWIQSAIKRKGALREKAKRMGLIKGEESMTAADYSRLQAAARARGDTRTLRQVALARTLSKM